MIAMALACEPKIIIADEPTTALDVTIQAQIIETVRDLREKLGTAVIWITHDLGVVAGLADRVVVMYGGRIVEEAPVATLYANPSHPYTRGLLNSLPSLDERGASLESIPGQPPSLLSEPVGCSFAPLPAAFDRCPTETPVLSPIDDEGGQRLRAGGTPTRKSVVTDTAVGRPDRRRRGRADRPRTTSRSTSRSTRIPRRKWDVRAGRGVVEVRRRDPGTVGVGLRQVHDRPGAFNSIAPPRAPSSSRPGTHHHGQLGPRKVRLHADGSGPARC